MAKLFDFFRPRRNAPGPWSRRPEPNLRRPARPPALRRALRHTGQALLFLGFGVFLLFAALQYERGTFAAVLDPVREMVQETLRSGPPLSKIVRHSPELSGRTFSAVDGDSLRSGGEDFRLLGIDAPELRQTCTRAGRSWSCGREAHARLRTLVAGGGLVCTPQGRDRYGRTLARCRAGGRDIGETMVREGLALDFMGGGYGAVEREARAARRGLWAGEFELPQDWRRRSGPRAAR